MVVQLVLEDGEGISISLSEATREARLCLLGGGRQLLSHLQVVLECRKGPGCGGF
jgi:hypothetical protein